MESVEGRKLNRLGPALEALRYVFINRAFEGHDQIGNFFQLGPTPRVKFWRVLVEPYIAVGAFKAQRVPFLTLTEIRTTHAPQKIWREVVIEPVFRLFENINKLRRNADFFIHFAKCGLDRFFAFVDTALRHLPLERAATIDASTDKDVPSF